MVVLVVLGVLLAAAATLTQLEVTSTRSSGMVVNSTRALYCAEAGLAAARPIIAANVASWNASLCSPPEQPCPEPPWLAAALNHDLDTPAVPTDPPDFIVIITDNDDEAVNDLDRDSDGTIQIVSTCLKYPDAPRQVTETVHLNAGVLERRMWIVTQ